MCRNIKNLRRSEQPPSEGELQAAAMQFIRKVSGYRTPSRRNREAFDQAVGEVATALRSLFEKLNARPEA